VLIWDSVVERLYEILLSHGYPPEVVDWLRRFRTQTIIALALLSWAIFIGVGWMLWTLAGAVVRFI
jgi:hypothetical protein